MGVGASASELCYAGEIKRVPEELNAYARELRNNSTKAERLLWLRLRGNRPRFTRQHVIEPYIVDLACREAKLAIELDGGQHAVAIAYDNRRTDFLESQGWVVVRLWNNEVVENPDGAAEFVLAAVLSALTALPTPSPSLPRRGDPGSHAFANPLSPNPASTSPASPPPVSHAGRSSARGWRGWGGG
ncbi:MAG: DUF559 domain-containing protein [Pseudomonadota bacterium]|nr:DUF559 domain-containing protein [Pseudomonadota bacterium]